jgi:hypothetical protein
VVVLARGTTSWDNIIGARRTYVLR